jgi:hypothetical protein
MTLNVITRADAKKDPVLVFIHGGSFENGNVGEHPYGTSTEYAERGIAYVSLGYRLNVFGLYKSGNYGLHDMVFGLRWIKEHIADFGGDPEKVPAKALSVGIGTVTDSKEVLVLISGHNKARALAATVEGSVSQKWTCSALQLHNGAIIACDEAACGELTVDTYKYFLDIERKERL